MKFIKYYTNNLPTIGEKVIFIINEINDNGIYSYLPEYTNEISFLSFNNIPKKSRKNIKKNFKKNKEYVGEVNNIDNNSEIKILLSLHYILEASINEKKKDYNLKMKLNNYLNYIFNNYQNTLYFSKPFIIILDDIILDENYNIYTLIKKYVINYGEYFENNFIDYIMENINKKIESKINYININFEIISSSYNGIDCLKIYFKNLINILRNIKFNLILVSTPIYKLSIESNKIKEIQEILETLELFFKEKNKDVQIKKIKIDKNF